MRKRMSNDNIQDWMDWVTGLTGAGEADPLLTRQEIEDIVDGVISTLGEFHTDPGTIPGSATSRARGQFDSPNDMVAYLEGGGLVQYSDTGQIIPSPIVHLLKVSPGGRALPRYEVWIDDNT
jgi:hypothetical protein